MREREKERSNIYIYKYILTMRVFFGQLMMNVPSWELKMVALEMVKYLQSKPDLVVVL